MSKNNDNINGPLTSENSGGKTTPIYLDCCKILNHFYTESDLAKSFYFSEKIQRLFFNKKFSVAPNGRVFINKSVGTNGAFLERVANNEFEHVGEKESNQLTPKEKARLLSRCNGVEPWTIQRDQFINCYTAMAREPYSTLNSLIVNRMTMGECEFYFEVPLFQVDEKFEEIVTKRITQMFGAPEKEKDFTLKKTFEDGDFRRWRIKNPKGLNRKAKMYLKAYEKGDFVRIEVRFEGVNCIPFGLPMQCPAGFDLMQMSIQATINFLGIEATQVLNAVMEEAMEAVPSLDEALLRKALKALNLHIDASKKYDELIKALSLRGAYTRSRLYPHLRLERRTLKVLAHPDSGILCKGPVHSSNGKFREFYVLRPDWEQQAQRLIEEKINRNSNLAPQIQL